MRYLLIIFLFVLSCKSQENKEVHATPKALEENSYSNRLSKTYHSDIISKLFNEAISENKELRLLIEKEENLNELYKDSTKNIL
jgi:hypothetical protein